MARTYLNNGGDHVGLDYECKHGKTITTDDDLKKKFPGKFTVVEAERAEEPEAPLKTKAEVKADAEAARIAKDRQEDKKNVTKDFKNANEEVIVLKDSKGWYVYDADDLKEPINEEPLLKKNVEAFLAEYLKEED